VGLKNDGSNRIRDHRIEMAYHLEEHQRWVEGIEANGFAFGGPFIRWMLTEYAEGRLIHINPGTLNILRMMGGIFGEQAGLTLAQMQQAYLERT